MYKNITNVIVAEHSDRTIYITEAYDSNGNAIQGLCGSTTSLEKMFFHLKSINFPQEQKFISDVPQIDDPRAKVLRELTEEEKQHLGRFFGSTITDRLLEYTLKHQEPYEVKVGNLELTVFPDVFPPVSPFSYDSIPLMELNDTKEGETVLDIGTGSGIHAIVSASKGAKKVIAIDISQKAIDNCDYNAKKHDLGKVIQARLGNLFEPVKWYERLTGFDLVIANLPFVNHHAEEFYEHWVYDQDYETHQQFFSNVGKYMKRNGRILMAFSDIGNVDFLEEQISSNGLEVREKDVRKAINQDWIVYQLGRKTSKK